MNENSLLGCDIITDLDDLDVNVDNFCRPLQSEKKLRIHLSEFLKCHKYTIKN